ncbi:MAG: AAA family ATPase [Bacteroidales bacterium]|nr:AAA family ATPase [Bacteroidales bacterium]
MKNKNTYDFSLSKENDVELQSTYFDLKWGKIYVQLFRELFSMCYENIFPSRFDVDKLINELLKKYDITEEQIISVEEFIGKKSQETIKERTFIVLKKSLCVYISLYAVEIFYGKNISRKEVLEIIAVAQKFKTISKKNNFYMITRQESNLKLIDLSVNSCETAIEDNYNDDFRNIHKIIINSLGDDKKGGIIMLHGKHGTGKTSYIRHLINSVDKKFIYMPPALLESIISPEFISFISHHDRSILILEDCEKLIMERENGNDGSNIISNLLNITDGLLSDSLAIKIICTFNTNLKNIDSALLRKGRMIARYEFNELEIHTARKLAGKIGITASIDNSISLADIYNMNSMGFENKKPQKIGFACS